MTAASPALAATYTTIAAGDWSSSSTWLGGSVPPISTIPSGDIVNICHFVTRDSDDVLINNGTVNIGDVSALASTPASNNCTEGLSDPELLVRTNVNVENKGEWYMNFAKFTQYRFVGGGDACVTSETCDLQSGSFKNQGGVIDIENSTVEVAQDWTNEKGDGPANRRFVNSCLITGQNFSNTDSVDILIDANVSIGWHSSGSFQYSDTDFIFENAQIQLAGDSGNFELNKGAAEGTIGYITFKNHRKGTLGSGEISAKTDLDVPNPPGLELATYCSQNPLVSPNDWTNSPTREANPACPQTDTLFPCVVVVANPSIQIAKSTNGQDADVAPGPFIPVGDLVSWAYEVTNTGDTALTGIAVTDDQGVTVTCPQTTLSVGESMTCTASGSAAAGQYANIGSVLASSPGNSNDVSDSDPSHYFGSDPSIDIEKATNGSDADTAPGPLIPVGESVTWSYVVQNTGNVALTAVAVTDDQLGAITCPQTTLAVGESMNCNAAGPASAGQYSNLGSVVGTPPVGSTVSDSDPSHYFGSNPSVVIEKSTNGSDADTAPGPFIAVGETVNWLYKVTNTGNVVLTDVTVTDSVLAPAAIDCGGLDGNNVVETLPIGESRDCVAVGTAVAGQYTNLGSVEGTPPVGNTVSDTDPSHYFGSDPAIQIVKTASPKTYAADGVSITYTFDVTNTGNVELTDVAVTDPLPGLGTITCEAPENNPIDDLSPGETVQCSASYTTTTEDVSNQSVSNTATATGQCTAGCPVDDTDDEIITLLDEPSITIVKTAEPKVYTTEGQTITYSLEVTNNGNVALSPVTVTDPTIGNANIDCDPPTGNNVIASLASGDSVTCEAEYTITSTDINNGKVDNTATAEGEYSCPDDGGCSVTDTDDETINAFLINLTKTVTAGPTYDPATGRYTVVYRIQATNSGTAGGTYDVVDAFDPAPGLNLVEPPGVAYAPGDDSLDPANNPPGWPTIADDEFIAAGKTEGWDVTAEFTVTPGDLTGAARSCDENDAQAQTGFYNKVEVTAGETNIDDNDDCVDLPDPDLDLSKEVTKVENTGVNSYQVTYFVKVVNSGDGPGEYDIDDVTGFGPGISLNGTPVVTYSPIGDLFPSPVTPPAWTQIALNETIAGQKSEAWNVVANFDIDPSNADYEANRQCATDQNGFVSGKGFFNRVNLTGFEEQDLTNNKACDSPDNPDINLAKTVMTAPAANPDGSFTVVYEIIASNAGQAIGAYDLKDTFSPGNGITLKSAELDYVGGSDAGRDGTVQGGSLPAAFNSGDTVVTGETLGAGKDEAWTVTAVFEINPVAVDETRKCSDVEFGEGTGFYNFVEGNIDEDLTDNHACANLPDPGINLEKTVIDGPTPGGGSTYTVVYGITATNSGDVTGLYDLIDTFDPGNGITLVSAELDYAGGETQTGNVKDGGSLPYAFQSGDTIITDEALAGGKSESWTVTAVFEVNLQGLDETQFCSEVDFARGTGFYNFVEGNIDEDLSDNHACTENEELARFRVLKVYTDGSDDEVEVTLTCNSGIPLVQKYVIAGGDPLGVTFTVKKIPSIGADCEVTEKGLAPNYTPSFDNGEVISETSCAWEDVKSGLRTCVITNTPDPATYTVTKTWIVPDAGFEEEDYVVDIEIACTRNISKVDGSPYTGGSSWSGQLSDVKPSVVVTVDTIEGEAMCSATEEFTQSGVEPSASAGCTDAELKAGGRATCEFTNTVFFEGVPTLNQWGLALLALLMLGVGVVGMRRIV